MEKTKPLILVADDDTAIQDTLKARLERLGAEVKTVGSLDETVEISLEFALNKRFPQIVILDMSMPVSPGQPEEHKQGLMILQRRYGLFPASSNIIVFTAYDSYDNCVDCIKAGAAYYFPKTINDVSNMDRLLEKCRELLKPSHASTQDLDWLSRNRREVDSEFRGKAIALFEPEAAARAGIRGNLVGGMIVLAAERSEHLARQMLKHPSLRWETPRIIVVNKM